jgi:hypothetical protein
MALLRKASVETKRLPLGEDGDYIEVRTEISKRDFNRFIGFMPAREVTESTGMTAVEALELQKGLFEVLVTGWSLEEPATVEAYEGLENEGATAIDTALAEHFKSLSPSKAEEKAGFRPE